MPGAVEPTPVTSPAPPRRRALWPWLAGGAVVLALIVVAVLALTGRGFEASGSLMFSPGCGYAGDGGYSDIRQGAAVTVKDAAGKTLALSQLGAGVPDGSACRFDFTVSDVPAGEKFYGVEVSRRGVVQYTEDQMRAGVTLSLG